MKTLIAIVTLAVAMGASAQSRIVSIDAFDFSYTGGLSFQNDKGASGVSNKKESNLRFNLNYAQDLPQYEGLMWKAKFHFDRNEVEGNVTSRFGIMGGGLYNFQASDIKNSVFAGAMVGLERASFEVGNKDRSGINMMFFLEGGKRWDLGSYAKINASYAPSISLGLTRYGGDVRKYAYKSASDFRINFLKFDILF